MAKRTLEDVFNNDPQGLLSILNPKSSKLGLYAIYYDTYIELKEFIDNFGFEPNQDSYNIHEAKLAARLKKLRNTPDALEALFPFDSEGLLNHKDSKDKITLLDLDDVFASDLLTDDDDIFTLKHVSIGTKTQTASTDMAMRKKCLDFENYSPIFKKIQKELDNGTLQTCSIKGIAEIKAGEVFILHGLIAYVAEMGEKHERRKGHHNARMKIVYSNGMESNLLLRSFGAALYKDKAARSIVGKSNDDIFTEESKELKEFELSKSGIVYVLKSNSSDPIIKPHREYLHKIGVTTSNVKKRIANSKKDATYLLGEVEIIAEYTLYNMNLKVTEKLLHTFFRQAQADIKIPDRFGNIVQPKEWFFLPFELIKQAIKLLSDSTIGDYKYDKDSVSIIKIRNHD
jgi:hypothetical protein